MTADLEAALVAAVRDRDDATARIDALLAELRRQRTTPTLEIGGERLPASYRIVIAHNPPVTPTPPQDPRRRQ